MKSLLFMVIMTGEILSLAALVIRDGWCDPASRQNELANVRLVDALMVTDLALWTEARYTRHPSQADCFTAFQNGPAALDQFPSGTWVSPSQHPNDLGTPSRSQR